MTRKSGSAVLREHLAANVGREIPIEELNEVCGKAGLHGWPRVIRKMKQEGYDIENNPRKWYKLRSLEVKPSGKKRVSINKKLRFLVLNRDNFTCQGCGRSPKKDGVTLHIDHIVPVDWGGETDFDNLQTLCSICNEGKQAWVSGEDAEVMKTVNAQTNAEDRLRIYFEAHHDEEITVDRLAVVAQIRSWTRQIRYLREHTGMNIQSRRKNKKENRSYDAYIYITGKEE